MNSNYLVSNINMLIVPNNLVNYLKLTNFFKHILLSTPHKGQLHTD